MSVSAGTPDHPLRVVIVGSGPSGFYAAGHLLKIKDLDVEVDMIDSLPTPFGLVRAGVAPDHPKIKSVIRVYEKTAANPSFRYFGNVLVGRDISHGELKDRYHAVIYAVGAQTDRQLNIPGEDLHGSFAATEFVAWYNAHPEFCDREFDLSCRRAVVIGNGNVAMDVARMLVLPRAELETTDTADHAIEALSGCAIEEVVILGRRGPAQAAFTNPELLELGDLTEADVIVDPSELELDEHSQRAIDAAGELTARKNVEILREFAAREPRGKPKRVVLRFLRSPVAIHGNGRVESVEERIGHHAAISGLPDPDMHPAQGDRVARLGGTDLRRSRGHVAAIWSRMAAVSWSGACSGIQCETPSRITKRYVASTNSPHFCAAA